ncbi:hypothetical protein [Actinoplanes derwentensis]|uniref:Uncharacterized protein n=1 Tax=Actinoplanes derwentensis TaxID=113562 RepID=A0A1H1ZGD4_9ACTN|nr:hypothetical protein [Actinoplanes derwentensis]GID82419.1 hypothetical protein Ade03nite_13430 [Actinoplanes derwentensis]SDT32562.1 hypothetical protein SAMN04489716_3301 [Actinoplanes derwentensis]
MSYNPSGRHAQPPWDGSPQTPPRGPNPAPQQRQYQPPEGYQQQEYPSQYPQQQYPQQQQQPPWQQAPAPSGQWQPTVPATAQWQRNNAGPSTDDRRWAYLRHSAGTSLRGTNAIHVTRALERLSSRQQPLAPHGITLFFVVEAPSQHLGYQILSASRWGYSGPEYDNLVAFLTGMRATAETFIAQHQKIKRVWDPRDPDFLMVNVGDIERSDTPARYVGLGMETLNTDSRQWYEVVPVLQSSGISSLQAMSYVPGEAAIRLVDGSEIRVVRDDTRSGRGNDLICNQPLDATQIYSVTQNVPEKMGVQLRQAWPAFLDLATTLSSHLNPDGQVW